MARRACVQQEGGTHTCTIRVLLPSLRERQLEQLFTRHAHTTPHSPTMSQGMPAAAAKDNSDRTHAVCQSRADQPTHTCCDGAAAGGALSQSSGCSTMPHNSPQSLNFCAGSRSRRARHDHEAAAAPVTHRACRHSHHHTTHSAHAAGSRSPARLVSHAQRVNIYSSDLSPFLRPSLSSTGSRYSCRSSTEREVCE